MSFESESLRLGDIASFRTGKLDSNAAVSGGTFPFFTCSPTTLSIDSFAFDTEAVVLAGNNANGVFATKYFRGKFNAYQRTYVIEPLNLDKTSCKFLYFLIQDLVGKLQELSIGSATKFLTKTILNELQVSLPTKHDQDLIASILTALDDRITLLRETNATLEAIAQALFKSWFVDFDPVRAKMEGRAPEGMGEATAALFPDGFEESALGLVPRGWRMGTLADLAEFQNGFAFKSKDWVCAGHPVVKIGDVKPGIIDFSGCSYVLPETTVGLDRFKLVRGDLLVGMTGYVGETGLTPSVEPAAYLNQRVGRISTKAGIHDLGFVYCLVRHPDFKTYAEAQSHGSAQANVGGSALLGYLTILPSINLLNLFNAIAFPILESVLSNHEQAQTLATLRDTLLPRLISGALRLPEAEFQIKEATA